MCRLALVDHFDLLSTTLRCYPPPALAHVHRRRTQHQIYNNIYSSARHNARHPSKTVNTSAPGRPPCMFDAHCTIAPSPPQATKRRPKWLSDTCVITSIWRSWSQPTELEKTIQIVRISVAAEVLDNLEVELGAKQFMAPWRMALITGKTL